VKVWQKIQGAVGVLLMTCLIWVYAERRVTRSDQLTIPIRLDPLLSQEHPELYVQLLDDNKQPIAQNEVGVNLTITGPTGRIQGLNERRWTPKVPLLKLSQLTYPEIKDNQPAIVSVDVAKDIFKEQLPLEESEMYLQVTQSDPAFIQVQITPKVQRQLPVTVSNQMGEKITHVTIEPAELMGWILPSEQDKVDYTVVLTPNQLLQAQEDWLSVEAVLKSVPPQRAPVKIKVKEGSVPVGTETRQIKTPSLGIVMPQGMIGKYKVVLNEDSQVLDPINCSGSVQALNSFEQSRYQLILEITAEDADNVVRDRTLRYFMPVQKDGTVYKDFRILDGRTRAVKFRLETAETVPAAALPRVPVVPDLPAAPGAAEPVLPATKP